jgi:hypothetical protein
VLSLGVTALTDPQYMTSRLTAHPTEFSVSPTSMPLTLVSALALTRTLSMDEIVAHMLLITKILTLLCAPAVLLMVWRTKTREQVISHSLLSLTLYLTVGYLQTMQWYYLWPLGLLCAMRWTPPVANAAAASCAVLLGYVMYFWTHNGWTPSSQVLAFLLCIALPVGVCLGGYWRGWVLCPLPESPSDRPATRRDRGTGRGAERTAAMR